VLTTDGEGRRVGEVKIAATFGLFRLSIAAGEAVTIACADSVRSRGKRSWLEYLERA